MAMVAVRPVCVVVVVRPPDIGAVAIDVAAGFQAEFVGTAGGAEGVSPAIVLHDMPGGWRVPRPSRTPDPWF